MRPRRHLLYAATADGRLVAWNPAKPEPPIYRVGRVVSVGLTPAGVSVRFYVGSRRIRGLLVPVDRWRDLPP